MHSDHVSTRTLGEFPPCILNYVDDVRMGFTIAQSYYCSHYIKSTIYAMRYHNIFTWNFY